MLLVGAASGSDGHAIRAKGAAKQPVSVAAVESFEEALSFLSVGQEAGDGRSFPSLVLVTPGTSDSGLSHFLQAAKEKLKIRPSPMVLVMNSASECEVAQWYADGVNSVITAHPDHLDAAIDRIYSYWLVHNRTPKHG